MSFEIRNKIRMFVMTSFIHYGTEAVRQERIEREEIKYSLFAYNILYDMYKIQELQIHFENK